MEEGRNVFEEGNAFTMEALQQQLDQLSACQDFQVSCCRASAPRGVTQEHLGLDVQRRRGTSKPICASSVQSGCLTGTCCLCTLLSGS